MSQRTGNHLNNGFQALRHQWRVYYSKQLNWRSRARWLRATPWHNADLLKVLLLFAFVQVMTAMPPKSTPPALQAWYAIALHVALIFSIYKLWLQRRPNRYYNQKTTTATVLPDIKNIKSSVAQALCFYLPALPVIFLAGLINSALIVFIGDTITLQPIALAVLRLTDWGTRLPLLIALVITAPIAEELVFRAVILPLITRYGGIRLGMIATASIFAIVHGHPNAILPLFVLALFLAAAYLHTRSLLTPIIMHALFNLTSISMLLLQLGN